MNIEQQRIVEEAIRDRQERGIPLSCMTFAHTALDDEGLSIFLQHGVDLQELYLMSTRITNVGIQSLRSCHSLRELDISRTKVTTEGLAWLASTLKLNSLTLNYQSVLSGGFHVLSQFKSLRSLEVSFHYGDPWIRYDREAGTPADSNDLCQLGNLALLEDLSLSGISLQEDSLDWLDGMKNLKNLCLSNTHASGPALAKLADNKSLSFLELSNTQLDDETFVRLIDALELKELGVASTKISSASIQYLVKNSSLESIFAENVTWSREASKELLQMPTLRNAELDIEGIPHSYLEGICPKNVNLHPK